MREPIPADSPLLSGFFHRPRLSSFFPIIFESGAKWTSFDGRCAWCDNKIADQDLRGTIRETVGHVLAFEAQGYCRRCRVLSGYKYRLHPDMTIDGFSLYHGKWTGQDPTRPLWRRVLDWIFGTEPGEWD